MSTASQMRCAVADKLKFGLGCALSTPVTAGGKVAADVPVYDTEVDALRAELNGARHASDSRGANAGRVVVLMCHEDREGVFDLLRTIGARPVDVGSELTELVPRLQGRPRRA